LKKSFIGAEKAFEESNTAFEKITKSLNPVLIEEWSREEEKAMRERGEALRIFEVKVESGTYG
jgi:hypothetical protein